MPMPKNAINLRIESNFFGVLGIGTRGIKLGLSKVYAFFDLDNTTELNLVLSDDKYIAELNQRFLGCPGPTNVLSFPSNEPKYLGDLIVSIPAVVREAFLYEQDRENYFWRMTLHGFLHLLGYEHGLAMDNLTEKLLQLVD